MNDDHIVKESMPSFLPDGKHVTLEEFYKLREQTTHILEYVDGVVFMSPSPATMHQRVSGRLFAKLFNLLDGKNCEVFHAPFDVVLKKENIDGIKVLVPDLTVICDKRGLNEKNYKGVPTLIIEIISPSNQSHDLVFKLNLYLQYGVREYWIVNPILQTVQVYALDEDKEYQQLDVKVKVGVIQSAILEGFEVDVEKLFA